MDRVLKPYRVLFLEDEDMLRKNYSKFLKKYFIEVYEARDGQEALDLYNEFHPNIMIVDINTPKLNGIEFLKRVRTHDHSTKAIMLTAHSDVEYLLKATELKLTKYLIKPISREDLNTALDLAIKEIEKFHVIEKDRLTLPNGYIWDFSNKELYFEDTLIELTSKESKVLTTFVENINKTLTYEDIIDSVWDYYEESNVNRVKTIVKTLRKKISKDFLKNIYGVGYKLEM